MKSSQSVSFFQHWCLLFISLFSLDFLFRILAQIPFDSTQVVRILLFNGVFSGFLCAGFAFLKKTLMLVVISFILLCLSLLGITQLTYVRYMNAYYSISVFLSSLHRVEGYVQDFIMSFKPMSLMLFLPVFFYSGVMWAGVKKHNNRTSLITILSGILISYMVHELSMRSLMWNTTQSRSIQLTDLYHQPYLLDLGMREFGFIRTMIQDGLLSINPPEEIELVEVEVITEPIQTEPILEISDLRMIDDAAWLSLAALEKDPILQNIDAYLLNRPISKLNDQSALFKDKNLVLVMIEAFDYSAMDPILTPTLTMLASEGWLFDTYYSPQYTCATGESEFMALTSLIPRANTCSPNTFTNNTYSKSLFELFNQAGYLSTSYHNYSDKFYERTPLHENMGSSMFYNNDDLNIKTLKGWPSDVNLMNEALPHFIENSPFFSFIITSSTHFPYDSDSTLGNRYLDQVQAVHPDLPLNIQRYQSKAMELDLALTTLIQGLKEQGVYESTVLVLFSDHFPLNTPKEDLLLASDPTLNRSYGYNINKTPMIIFTPGLTSQRISIPSSTLDLLPTLANLFDLNHDPRYYFGSDIFDLEANHRVAFASMNWLNTVGMYSIYKDKFTPNDESIGLSKDEIQSINDRLSQDAQISTLILKHDYYKNR